jgi:hypothetical protein
MRTRTLTLTALLALLPASLFAAPSSPKLANASPAASVTNALNDDCGRGNAWGCRRKRGDDRYDDRRDRDRYESARYDRERYERERWERERYARERYEQERYERARWERERAREEWRWRHRDRRYERYDGYPVACIRAGGRIIGSAVLVICVP